MRNAVIFLQGIDIDNDGSHELVVGAPRWRGNDDLHLGGGTPFFKLFKLLFHRIDIH